MSLVIDALRRGRGRQLPPTTQHAAQADAVLQTLGQARPRPAAAAGRFKRSAGFVAAAFLVILALWWAVVGLV